MFTRVFNHDSTQDSVFEHTAIPLLKKFLDGDNCVLFAYGMTNAGKTHTIQGTTQNPGILPRLVSKVLEFISTRKNHEFHASMLEVYQDNIYDLLGKRKEKLSIRDGSGKVEVAKLSYHAINSTQDAYKLMDTAASKRTKASTFLNTGSSRSHAVYTLTLSRPSADGKDIVTSSFQLVDLAGAERGNRTKATSAQQKEANIINTSLMQLWRCLQAVKRRNADLNGSMEVIPFRESKLTHLLMPILSRAGLSGVAMVACVNPQPDDYDETLSILSNASIASKIREFADVGRVASDNVPHAIPVVAPPAPPAPTPTPVVVPAPVSKGIRLEDLKDYKDKQAAVAAAAAAALANSKKRKHSESSTSNLKRTTSKRGIQPNIKTMTISLPDDIESGRSSELTEGTEYLEEEEDGQQFKKMKSEIQSLKEMNEQLIQQSIYRESEIRKEVSEEMMMRSNHLLNTIQDLRNQLDSKNDFNQESISVNTITKSCKKIQKNQRLLAEKEIINDLKEAEEELDRMKNEFEIEKEELLQKNEELQNELVFYKQFYEVHKHLSTKGVNNLVNQENGVSVLPVKKSPNRSPLSPLTKAHSVNNISPAANKHNILPMFSGANDYPSKKPLDINNNNNNLKNSPQRLRSAVANGGGEGNGSYFNRLRSQYAR